MVSIRKLVHALALLAVISLLVAAPTNAAQDGLISASVAGDLPRVKSLLAANADVDAKGLDGSTALIAASFAGHLEVVQTLLAAKADVNAKALDGGTALMGAAGSGHVEVVRALLAANADVNAKDNHGMTALMMGASTPIYVRGDERARGHLEVVQNLLAAKADVNAKDANGYTALFRASQLDVVQALLAAKADVKANVGGFTALSVASARGDQKVVQALLAADADVNAKGLDGSTALIMASSAGHGGGADLARSQRRCERQVVGHWRNGYKSGHKARLRGDSATPESGRMHS